MPRVSVVMPVYNGEKYLPETIESVLNQTFEDFEFIIVNEFGSNEAASAILKHYAELDARIRIIQNTEKLGLPLSLNAGIDAARGEYIARVDGDDPSYPERFAKQVAYLDEHPDIFLCGTLQRTVRQDGTRVEDYPADPDELKATLLFGTDILHCSVMMRRGMLIENNWKYTDEFLAEDYDLWTKVMHKAGIANLPEVLVDHRWGFGQKSVDEIDKNGKVIVDGRLQKHGQLISARALAEVGVNIAGYDYDYVLGGFRTQPWELGKTQPDALLEQNYDLLREIEDINNEKRMFDPVALHNVLARRWVKWLLPCVGNKGKQYHGKRFTDYRDIAKSYVKYEPRELISHPARVSSIRAEIISEAAASVADNIDTSVPVVSVVMTVYNGAAHIRSAIDSVTAQTFTDWEMLIINEYGSLDGTAEIVSEYTERDRRIILIQNNIKLGFAESLNVGIRMARGKYIARMDADDLAVGSRFEKEVAFLEANPEYGVVGSWQKHFGRDNWVHRPLQTHDEIAAALLFRCDLCHSTLMLRRSVFVENNLYYDGNFHAEDFELWTRAVCMTKFATIPEILGKYRKGEASQTDKKYNRLVAESGYISAKSIERVYGLKINEEDYELLQSWQPHFNNAEMALRFKEILLSIWYANKVQQKIDDSVLLIQLYSFWRWAAYGEDWKNRHKIRRIDDLINDDGKTSKMLPNYGLITLKSLVKKLLKRLALPIMQRLDWRFDAIKREFNSLYWRIDKKIWDTEKILRNHSNSNRAWIVNTLDEHRQLIFMLTSLAAPYVPYVLGEKVRIVFVYLIPSFWPNWDTLLEALRNNHEADVKIVLFDIPMSEPEQIRGAEDLLVEKGIEYVRFDDFDIDVFKPHIVVHQTPYDGQRPAYLSAPFLRAKGARIAYVTYGIEITKTIQSESDHFKRQVVQNSWRVYTFSPSMRLDYLKYVSPLVVKALGHPKFDRLYSKDTLPVDRTLIERGAGRKVVLLKIHWTKKGGGKVYTPDLSVYMEFVKLFGRYDDLFFAVMPHPNFFHNSNKFGFGAQAEKFRLLVESMPNAMLCLQSDYRPVLVVSDYIITDRSSVMVEAGVLDVPVMYMTGKDWEPLNDAVQPIIMSYYLGKTCEDMVRFLEMCREGHDPKRTERQAAVREYIPYFDGKCGERIAQDMIDGVKNMG